MFDVFPAKETSYEPRFRDESLFMKDKNGIPYKERRYVAPEVLNSDDSKSLKQNRKNFKDKVNYE